MADDGMSRYRAVVGSWAIVRPPPRRTTPNPSAPSDPVPDKSTAIARSPATLEIDVSRTSMLGCGLIRGSAWRVTNAAPRISTSVFGDAM